MAERLTAEELENTEPTNEHAKALWRVCQATITNPDCVGLTQLIALFVKSVLETEEKLERQIELTYSIKADNARLRAAIANHRTKTLEIGAWTGSLADKELWEALNG